MLVSSESTEILTQSDVQYMKIFDNIALTLPIHAWLSRRGEMEPFDRQELTFTAVIGIRSAVAYACTH
jgi:hypothetical protein